MKTSNSALEQYERCPHQYYQERIQKNKGRPTQAMQLGRVCHSTIERLMKKHLEDGQVKPFDATLANEIYAEEWGKEHGLSGEDLFTEGLQMIVNFIEQWSPMDPARILGIEEWFEITLAPGDDDALTVDQNTTPIEESDHAWDCPEHGPQMTPHCMECLRERTRGVTLRGVIDLVLANDQIDESTGEVLRTIEVIDYKSTHAFLTTRDADSSLQLAIYDMAARQKCPDAAKYVCSLHMLQTSTHIQIIHDTDQLDSYKKYILATAKQIESEENWPTKLGSDCAWCHIRHDCLAYKKALATQNHIATETMTDLERLAEEREEVAIRAKIFNKRLDEIDDVLKENLSRSKMPLTLAGQIFKLSMVETIEYEPQLVIDILSERLGMSPIEIAIHTMDTTKKKLEAMLTTAAEKHGLTAISMVKAAMLNRATRKYHTRMTHKKDKDSHRS